MPKQASSSSHHSSRSHHSSSPSHHSSLHSSPNHPFQEQSIDEYLFIAEQIILKWDPNGSYNSPTTSLWQENRTEANDFLKSVLDLQKTMRYLVSNHTNSQKLIHSQNLMQIAIKRLEIEFYRILSVSRDYLISESISGCFSRASRLSISDYDNDQVSDDISDERVPDLAVTDMRSIAECMISSGYGKECVKIYKNTRKPMIDEGLHRLGIEKLNFSQVQKLEWDIAEMKIKTWVNAVKLAVKTVFSGERFLCDHVFAASDTIRESCFAQVCREGAMQVFVFPENVAKCKKSPEKMFRILDMYGSLLEPSPEIELIFSFDSISAVRSQVASSMTKLKEAFRVMLHDFESAIQKDSSKAKVPGGGIHPLNRYVMNYLSFLADYHESLVDITADWPLQIQSPLLEDYYIDNTDENSGSSVRVRFAWLILVLLCKLDSKAELYKDVSSSYLFLMNNLQYIVGKVRDSNLRFLLGDDWIAKHEEKVRLYASTYEKTSWIRVTAFLHTDLLDTDAETTKECLRKFNTMFDETYRKQASWIVSDRNLRDELKISILEKIVPAYRTFYDNYSVYSRGDKNMEGLIRFSPEDLETRLSDLFNGTAGGIDTSGGSSSPSHFPSH